VTSPLYYRSNGLVRGIQELTGSTPRAVVKLHVCRGPDGRFLLYIHVAVANDQR